MDIQYLLTINLMVVSALAIVSNLMNSPWRENLLWVAVNALVIAVGAGALHWHPQMAGTLAALVFVPFVMGPILFSVLARRAQMRGKKRLAASYAWVAALLHPVERTRFNAALMSVQANPDAAGRTAALRELASRSTPVQRFQIEAMQKRADSDWQGLLSHLRHAPDRAAGVDSLRIRALGELGRLDEMARTYEEARERLAASAELLEAQLVVLAFSGRLAAVEALLQRHPSLIDAEARLYWTAVAYRAAGAPDDVWKPPLDHLAGASSEPMLRQRAATLARTPPVLATNELTAAARAILDRIEDRLERQAPMQAASGRSTTPVTWSLLAIIIAVYVLEEVQGGSENLRALVDLGALWPPLVVEREEWWRLVSAFFLHYGPLHAGANGLMLWALGRPCEQAFGSLRMLAIYFAGGLASTTFVLGLYLYADAEPSVLVGASGAIMAIFGGLVGHRLVAWLRHRDVLDRRFLSMVPFIIALQFAADLSMPQVSMAAHASGFVAGLLLGGVLAGFAMRQGRRTVHQTAG